MLNINSEVFKKNLLLTQLYCDIQESNIVANEALTDVSSVFRSFMPEIDGKEVMEFGVEKFRTGGTTVDELVKSACWTIDPLSEDKYINNFYLEQMAYKEKCLEGVSPNPGYKGNIVVTQVDLTVVDGACEFDSYFFFDLYDLPPIDTWFYLTTTPQTRLLFAWIPDTYCGWVDNAILVNCVEMIGWFKTVYPDDYRRLQL